MALKFFGRSSGSGYADDHTSAYFSTENKDMVMIDCPVSTFQSLKRNDLRDYNELYILITHTHGDHIGGLGLFVNHVFFDCKKRATIVAPSKAVLDDIYTVLTIEGIQLSWFKLVTVENVACKEWFGDLILTKHDPFLENRCFGYHLLIDGTDVIYTGDTSTLQPFLPYLTDGSTLYVDTSVFYVSTHLKLENALDDFLLLTKRGIKVYLMHLDNVPMAEKIIEGYPNIEVVTLD